MKKIHITFLFFLLPLMAISQNSKVNLSKLQTETEKGRLYMTFSG